MSEPRLEFGATYSFPLSSELYSELEVCLQGQKRIIANAHFEFTKQDWRLHEGTERDEVAIVPIKTVSQLAFARFTAASSGVIVSTTDIFDHGGFPVNVRDRLAPIQKALKHFISHGFPIEASGDTKSRRYKFPTIKESRVTYLEQPQDILRLAGLYSYPSKARQISPKVVDRIIESSLRVNHVVERQREPIDTIAARMRRLGLSVDDYRRKRKL